MDSAVSTPPARAERERLVRRLTAEAVERWSAPVAMAERAAAATSQNIEWDVTQTDRSWARTRAYFWGTLRRMAIGSRSTEAAPLRARFALATIVDDLRACGLEPDAVRCQLAAAHADLLEESGIDCDHLDVAC
jgi:hypothetical protein